MYESIEASNMWKARVLLRLTEGLSFAACR